MMRKVVSDTSWLSLDKEGLSKLNPRKPVVIYLKRLLDGLRMGNEDSYAISLSSNMIKFRCSYLTHCRIVDKISCMFLYNGISFDECHVELSSEKIRSLYFSVVSPVSTIIITLNEATRNKCVINVTNKMNCHDNSK